MPGLIGKKIGMTSVFSADGKNIPCTVIEVGPCVVTQVKTVEKDGYKAYQLGFEEAKEKRTSQPMMGIFKKAGTTPKKHLAEFKFDEEYNLGDTITVEIFNDCKFVDVIGTGLEFIGFDRAKADTLRNILHCHKFTTLFNIKIQYLVYHIIEENKSVF